MELTKAIATLTTITNHGYWTMTPLNSDAIKLGIEALKREKSNRDNPHFIMVGNLPGETLLEDSP